MKKYSEEELRAIGMDEAQIAVVMKRQKEEPSESVGSNINVLPASVVQLDSSRAVSKRELVPTSLEQIASYKGGAVVELPPFADGQPFVARVKRPSMLGLMKTGKIPNSLLNQATSLFANGAQALNGTGKNATNASELFDVMDVVVEAALLEPTLNDIHSVGMELSDDQIMAIFSYTQKGVKALEQFRTV